jgi:hypothetical protein
MLLCALPAFAQTGSDELTRMVAAYDLTMQRIEAYGAVMSGLADWAVAKPKEAEAMRARTPKGPKTVEQSAAAIEKEPAVKALLDKYKITGRDLVLIPVAVMQAQIAAMGEAQGRTFPADKINAKNTALAKANGPRIDEIMRKVAADRAKVSGK